MTQRINSQWYFYFMFDIAIRFVLLNVIRGITVDTFSELRVAKIEKTRDIMETCFICGLDKQIFDRDKASRGFRAHIKKEHNMWNYLYFIIYIWEQDKDDDDGLEQYVRRCIDSNDISWLPTNKAICLTVQEDDEGDKTRKVFQHDVNNLEHNFVTRLTDCQSVMYSKIAQVEAILMLSNPTIKPTASNILTHSPSQEAPETPHLLQRTDTNAHQGASSSQQLIIEINEISGLTFASRMLDTISCVVRSACGMTIVKANHVMHRANAPSLVLFDPCQVVVVKNYHPEKSGDDVVSIQVARGISGSDANIFVGCLNVSVQDLAAADGSALTKAFEARVQNSTCRGYVTMGVEVVMTQSEVE